MRIEETEAEGIGHRLIGLRDTVDDATVLRWARTIVLGSTTCYPVWLSALNGLTKRA